MERVCLMCLLLCMMMGVMNASIITRQVAEDESGCSSYAYCRGESFPHRLVVKERVISCRDDVTNKTLRESCCLPQEHHFVCYDIKVEGEYLNYSKETIDVLVSTDFSDLCRVMMEEIGQTSGVYNSAAIVEEGGATAFLYGKWDEVDPSENHIGHLACGAQE